MPAHSRRRGKDGRDTVVGSNFVVLSSCGFYSEERKGSQSIAGLWTFPCLLLRACPSASAGPGGASGLAVSRGLSEGSAAVSCAAQTCHGFLFFLSFQFLCNRAGPRRGQRSRGAASRCRFQGRGAWINPCCTSLPPAAGPPPAGPAASFVPPASCQAGVRALNAGEGPADGYHRWSVEIGRMGLSHRPFLRTQQKPPNKSTKIPKITKRKCHLSFAAGLCGGGCPAVLLLACTRADTPEVTRVPSCPAAPGSAADTRRCWGHGRGAGSTSTARAAF